MENKWAFGIGIFAAIGIAYAIYKFIKGSESEPSSGSRPSEKITTVNKVDYEMLYGWLKKECQKPNLIVNDGYKFGIMPSSFAKQTYREEFNKDVSLTDGRNILCVFIIDDKEENIISNRYFIFEEMGQSLKDILHSNKVYIQELKR